MIAFLEIEMREREKPGTLGTDIRFRRDNHLHDRALVMASMGQRNWSLVALRRVLHCARLPDLAVLGLSPARVLTVVKRVAHASDGRRDVRANRARHLLNGLPRRSGVERLANA